MPLQNLARTEIKTFLVTGHETTATAMAWGIYELACNQRVQTKLRKELIAMKEQNEQPSIDELMALPYFDGVVKEMLRLRTPIPYTMRVATKDDVIPLKTPFVGKDGKTYHELRCQSGDMFIIPLEGMNRDRTIWGPDALEMKCVSSFHSTYLSFSFY